MRMEKVIPMWIGQSLIAVAEEDLTVLPPNLALPHERLCRKGGNVKK